MPIEQEFYNWCKGIGNVNNVEIRLFCNQVDTSVPFNLQNFVEPLAQGYQRAAGHVWAYRREIVPGLAIAESGALTWVCAANTTSKDVIGWFAKMIGTRSTGVAAVQFFRQPKRFSQAGDRIAFAAVLASNLTVVNPGDL